MSGDLGESDPQPYPSGGGDPQAYPPPDGATDPEPRTTTWVGRATARAPVPPLEHTGYLAPPPQVVVVEVPRRRSGGRMVLLSLGIVAAFCAIGATALLVTQALLRGAPGAAAPAPPGRTTPAPAPTPTRPGLDTPVRDGMLQFTVTRVSCGHKAVAVSVINRKAHGQFCLVDVKVVNVGKDSRGFAEAFQKATGTNGTTYTPDSAAGLIVNSGGKTLWSTVNPGNRVIGTIVFDIPRDTQLASLELHDSPFSDGTTVTLA